MPKLREIKKDKWVFRMFCLNNYYHDYIIIFMSVFIILYILRKQIYINFMIISKILLIFY